MISLPDPANDAEGGIDPLGVLSIADRFSASMVPGVAQRMSRIRFLSLACAQAVVNEGISSVASDGTTAELVFEWITVQAFAALDDDIRRIPGIGKARAVLRDNAPMTSRAYLKGPKVFGFHGVYKTLGVALGLYDDDLRLMANGERLVSAMEKCGPLAGLLTGKEDTPGGKWGRRMRDLVRDGLEQGAVGRPRNLVFDTVTTALRPDRVTKPEAALLRSLLAADTGGTRGEMFALLDRPEIKARWETVPERALLRSLRSSASPALAVHLDGIEGFEGVVKPLQDAFDWIRFLSSQDRTEPVRPALFAREAPDLVATLREGLEHLPGLIALSPHAALVDSVAVDFAHVRTMSDLFAAVVERHERAQKRKPPNGKRSWFERAADGSVVVRPMYLRAEPPVSGDFAVHLYRAASIFSFLDDLGSAV